MRVTDLNTTVRIRKTTPMTYKQRLSTRATKHRREVASKLNQRVREDTSGHIALNGFMLLEMCKTKLPHEVRTANLSGRQIN